MFTLYYVKCVLQFHIILSQLSFYFSFNFINNSFSIRFPQCFFNYESILQRGIEYSFIHIIISIIITNLNYVIKQFIVFFTFFRFIKWMRSINWRIYRMLIRYSLKLYYLFKYIIRSVFLKIKWTKRKECLPQNYQK